MSLKDQSTLRVVLYEGDGAQPLTPDERFTALTALLERGYAVTRTTTQGSVAPADRTSLLVLGKFNGPAPQAQDANGQVTVRFQNLDSTDATHVTDLVESVPGGPRGSRWLLVGCLREAPDHDQAATDLRPYLPAGSSDPRDIDKVATKAGRRGVLTAGLVCLDALAAVVGEGMGIPREELLAMVLPGALVEHDLLRSPSA